MYIDIFLQGVNTNQRSALNMAKKIKKNKNEEAVAEKKNKEKKLTKRNLRKS